MPRRRKLRPAGEGALHEIQKMQRSTDLIIPKAAISRLVWEVTESVTKSQFWWSVTALGAIHEALEAYAVKIFERSQLAAIYGKCVKIHEETP
jgi:histone H3